MERFTRIEIGWIAEELSRRSAEMTALAAQDDCAGLAAGMYALRAEQYEGIAKRLRKVLDNEDKRIEIL